MRCPGSLILMLFSLQPLVVAVLPNAPKPWTLQLGPDLRHGHAATCSGRSRGPGEMDKTWVTASPPPTPPAQKLPPLWSLGETQQCCPPPWRPRHPTPPARMKTCWISRTRDSTGMEPSHSANQRSAFPKTHLTATDLDSGPNSAPIFHWSNTRRGLSLLLACYSSGSISA